MPRRNAAQAPFHLDFHLIWKYIRNILHATSPARTSPPSRPVPTSPPRRCPRDRLTPALGPLPEPKRQLSSGELPGSLASAPAEAKGREARPNRSNPRAPAWLARNRACQGQAGARGFVDGQIREVPAAPSRPKRDGPARPLPPQAGRRRSRSRPPSAATRARPAGGSGIGTIPVTTSSKRPVPPSVTLERPGRIGEAEGAAAFRKRGGGTRTSRSLPPRGRRRCR